MYLTMENFESVLRSWNIYLETGIISAIAVHETSNYLALVHGTRIVVLELP